MILEGHILPDAPEVMAPPAPSASGFGLTSTRARKIEIGVMTHRANPLWPAVIYHPPPNEATEIARLWDRCFLPCWKQAIEELVDFARPAHALPDHFAFVSIRKTHPWQARKVASALWGLTATMTTKILVIVDHPVDVHDEAAVWFHVGANTDLSRDLMFHEGPASHLDHANPADAGSRKMALDATAKLPEEQNGVWPEKIASSDVIREQVARRWSEFGLK